MSHNPTFDLEHLKKTITELEDAEEKIKKQQKATHTPDRTLSPQLKKTQFAEDVVNTSLFQQLQLKFFETIPTLGQEILTVCEDAYNNQKLTNVQRDELAKIGNTLATELPFKMLSGTMTPQKGFKKFMDTLRSLHNFLKANAPIVSDIGAKLLSLFSPFKNFLTSSRKVVEESNANKLIKEGFSERLNIIEEQSNHIHKTLQSPTPQPAPSVSPPSIHTTKSPAQSPSSPPTQLQKGLTSAIFPIGKAILNAGFSLFSSNILNEKQRDELANIGTDIMSIPYKLLTGKLDFTGALTGLAHGIQSLGNFLASNPSIALKIGVTILSSLLPLGGFLQKAFSFLSSAPVQDAIGGLFQGVSGLSKEVNGLENTLENSAKHALETPQRG